MKFLILTQKIEIEDNTNKKLLSNYYFLYFLESFL